MEVPPLLSYVTAYFALFGAIYAAFNATEGILKPEAKRRIGQWIGKPKDDKHLFD